MPLTFPQEKVALFTILYFQGIVLRVEAYYELSVFCAWSGRLCIFRVRHSFTPNLASYLSLFLYLLLIGILESAQSLQPLEEALETLSVPQCSQVWQFIEARIAEVTTVS